jgi:hypothetical protein
MNPRPTPRAVSRPRRASRAAYALFYSGVTFGVGLLAYAGVFLSGPPAVQQGLAPLETPQRIARIQLSRSDGRGHCRQMMFDNNTGRFEEAVAGPCQGLIPDELLVDTVRARGIQTDAFIRAFRR